MNALAQIGFNLLINGMLSFAASLAIVYAVLHGFRIGSGFTRRALLLLPLLKLGWDWYGGIPDQSFLWAKLHGATQELGSFTFGVGWSLPASPRLLFRLGAISHGVAFPQSAGDVLHAGLSKKLAAWVPDAVLGVVLLICALRVALRLYRWLRIAVAEHGLRSRAVVLETRRVGSRTVPIYVSGEHTGAPFATGTLSPCVVVPGFALSVLSEPMRAAAIEHELSHLRHFDPARLIALALASDLLWFMPGITGLLARMRAEIELRADRSALARGAEPEALAAALVRVAEHVRGVHVAVADATSLFTSGRALKARVARLLGDPESDSPALRLAHPRRPNGRASAGVRHRAHGHLSRQRHSVSRRAYARGHCNALNYYAHSNKEPAMLTRRPRTANDRSHRLALCVTVMLLAAGCAHAAEPMRLSLAQVRQGKLADWRADGPLIVEFQAGDRLPVEIAFHSEFFAFAPPPGMELVVKEHCFVRFGGDGIRTSPDGVDFEAAEPGRFGIHLATTKTTPTTLRLDIVAPRHAK